MSRKRSDFVSAKQVSTNPNRLVARLSMKVLYASTSLAGTAAALCVSHAIAAEVPRSPIYQLVAPQLPSSAGSIERLPVDLTKQQPTFQASTPRTHKAVSGFVPLASSTESAPQDLTVQLDDISTTGDWQPGISADSSGEPIEISAGNITTSGTMSDAVHAHGSGPIYITTGAISTSGENAKGIFADGNIAGAQGDIVLNTTDIVTKGNYSTGIWASAYEGNVGVTANSIRTEGHYAAGIAIDTSLGDAMVQVGSVTVSGQGSAGILAASTGTTSVTAQSVQSSGKGIEAIGTSTYVNVGSVTTSGDNAEGIYAHSNLFGQSGYEYPDFNIFAGQVATSGSYSTGIYAKNQGEGGLVGITVDQVSTGGFNSHGILAIADGFVGINANSVETSGDSSIGIAAISDNDGVSLQAGSVTTHGDGSLGLYTFASGPIQITADNVLTHGTDATGIVAIGVGGDLVIKTGLVSTSGNGSYGIYAKNYSGALTSIESSSVTTKGDNAIGIVGTGFGDIAVKVDQVSTDGALSNGIIADSVYGDVTVTAGTVHTKGDYSYGVIANIAGANNVVKVDVGDVDTSGKLAVGILAQSGGGVALSAGDITTSGDLGAGVVVNSNTSNGPRAGDPQSALVALGNVTTTGDGAAGVVVTGRGSISFTADTVTTTGDMKLAGRNVAFSTGVSLKAAYGNIDANINAITTSGKGGAGFVLSVVDGNGTANIGKIETSGEHAGAMSSINFYGDTHLSVGTIDTHGNFSNGVNAYSFGIKDDGSLYQIAIDAGSIATEGDSSIAVHVQTQGDLFVNADTLATSGDYSSGIDAIALGAINIDVGSITTNGHDSAGIRAQAYYGDINIINASGIATKGDFSPGIEATSLEGGITITGAGSVSTVGQNSTGIYAVASGNGAVAIEQGNIATSGDLSDGIYASALSGSTSVKANTIATSGTLSYGAIAISGFGKASLDAASVTTHGYGSIGAMIVSGTGTDVHIGNVETFGDNAMGVRSFSGYSTDENGAYIRGDSTLALGSVTTHGIGSVGIAAHANVGDISVGADSISTSGEGSTGLEAMTLGGNTTVHVGSVITSGDASFGMALGSNGGDVQAAFNQITTSGLGSVGVYASSGFGNISIDAGSVTTSGNSSSAIRLETQYGDAHVTLNGVVKTAGDKSWAIFTTSAFGSDLLIDNKGKILTSGYDSAGINSNVLNGHATINGGTIATTGEKSSGIQVFAVGDTKAITVTADSITTTGANSHGISVQNPDDGAIQYRLGSALDLSALGVTDHDKNISVAAKAVQVSGAGSIGIRAVGVADVSIDAGAVGSATADAIELSARNQAALKVTGAVVGGADGVHVSGADANVLIGTGGSISGAVNGLVISAAGPYVAPPENDDGGIGTFSIAAGGTATVINSGTIAGGSGYAIKVNDGTALIENVGTLMGAVQFGSGDDSLSNAGNFIATKDSDFGSGNDVFVNTGTLSVRAGKQAGSVQFLGLERFENRGGIVDLRNGVAGDTFTLPGTYLGSDGARLGLDVGSGGKADMLVIGGIASGSTDIVLNATAADATLLAQPVTLVRAGAGTAANAFTIVNQDIGLVGYGLTFDPSTNSFRLATQAGAAVHRLNQITQGAQAIWHQQADAWSSHTADLRDTGGSGKRIWGQMSGKVDTRHASGDGLDLGYRQDYYGAQVGVDLGGVRNEDAGKSFLFGLTGGYLSSHLTLRGGGERLRYDTLGLGGYASFQSGPIFANLLSQYNHYRIDAQNSGQGWSDKLGGNGYGAAGEIGARLGDDGFFAEPTMSLSWQHSDIGTLHALGQSVSFGHGSALDGKLGARIGGAAKIGHDATAHFYARGSYVHRFSGTGAATLESNGIGDSAAGAKIGDYGQGALGVNIATSGRISGFIEGNADIGSAYKGAGGRAGISLKF